jgi:hypothetical protein
MSCGGPVNALSPSAAMRLLNQRVIVPVTGIAVNMKEIAGFRLARLG